MSVDIAGMGCQFPAAECMNPPRAVTNLLVFIGGYDKSLAMTAGNPLTRNDSNGRERTSYTAYRTLQGQFSSPSKSKAMDPDLRNNDRNMAVRNGIDFIRDNFDPLGRLVIYGFSAGGFLALRLCERLSRYFGWYDFETNRIGGLNFSPASDNSRFARVKVDLLVTVDPCMQDSHDPHPATFAPGVRRHENFWQNQPRSTDDEHYWGVSLPRAHESRNEHPQGQHWHDQMPIHTLTRVQGIIQEDLSLQGTCFPSRAAGGGAA